MPASRSSIAFFDQRDAEPARAGFERGAGDRHRAVAVAVGLHDREQRGRARRARAARARWRAPPRGRSRPRPVGRPRSRRLFRDGVGCATPAAYEVARRRGRTPRARARRARARPLARARTRRSTRPWNGPTPCASSPAITPVSTSPVPAVASAGPPVGLITAAPHGVAITVPGSLEQHDRLEVAARASRAAPTRSAPTGWPASRSYSPACGVSTAIGSPASCRARSIDGSTATAFERVGVDHESGRRLPRRCVHAADCVAASRPSPGPIATTR